MTQTLPSSGVLIVENTEATTEDDTIALTTVYALLFWIFLLFVIIVVLCAFLSEQQFAYQLILSDTPFQSDRRMALTETNRLFTGYEDVDFVCISMEHRKATHFERLKAQLGQEAIHLNWFPGIDGKKLNMDECNLSRRYRMFFENNIKEREAGKTKTDYRGHLGCTLSHLGVIESLKNLTVIFEDDAEVVPNFRQRFQSALGAVTAVDPDWEVLLLGWCCNYKDHFYCKDNDQEPIQDGGIVKVHYWIGGWAYCLRNYAAAQKILKMFSPLTWHIDLTLAEAARTNNLKVYACMPTLANHAGWLRISSFDFYQKGDPSFIKSDTNL